MKAAKRRCDAVDLPLVIAGYAADFVHVRVDRIDKNLFEVEAWERIDR